MTYDGLPPVADFIERYSLRARKSLGQNFICDLNVTDKIARSVPDIENSVVVEVGSGPAGLTRALLKNGAKKVVAIELDQRAIGILSEIKAAYGDRLEIVEGDAMSVDFRRWGEARICANLPYNISVPLLVKWIYESDGIPSMTLMFQREVARRITAAPPSSDYGRISVLAQLCYRAKIEFDVPPKCFVPAPSVVSSVVGFARLDARPSQDDLRLVEETTKIAFGQRRKMLRANFDEKLLADVGLTPQARPQEVPPRKFLALARNRALDPRRARV